MVRIVKQKRRKAYDKKEREEFIERMEEFGDVWEDNDVKRVYGDWELEDALNDRMTDMHRLHWC